MEWNVSEGFGFYVRSLTHSPSLCLPYKLNEKENNCPASENAFSVNNTVSSTSSNFMVQWKYSLGFQKDL